MIDFQEESRVLYIGKTDRAQEWAGPDCADSVKPTAKIYVVVKYKP